MGKTAREWGIAKLVRGDGSKSKCGRVLKAGRYYASASLIGGMESFHEIDVQSVKLNTRSDRKVSYRCRRQTPRSAKLPLPRGPRVRFSSGENTDRQKQAALLKGVISFCSRHPGFAVEVGGPGARDESTSLKDQLVHNFGPLKMKSNDGECYSAAIVNAIDCLKGSELAEKARASLEEHHQQIKNLKQIGRVVNRLRIRCEVRKVKVRELPVGAFDWLGGQSSGVWIVRLVQGNEVDHCVVIDGNRQLILDSAENYPIRLSAECLRLCGGDEVPNLQVAEIRELRAID